MRFWNGWKGGCCRGRCSGEIDSHYRGQAGTWLGGIGVVVRRQRRGRGRWRRCRFPGSSGARWRSANVSPFRSGLKTEWYDQCRSAPSKPAPRQATARQSRPNRIAPGGTASATDPQAAPATPRTPRPPPPSEDRARCAQSADRALRGIHDLPCPILKPFRGPRLQRSAGSANASSRPPERSTHVVHKLVSQCRGDPCASDLTATAAGRREKQRALITGPIPRRFRDGTRRSVFNSAPALLKTARMTGSSLFSTRTSTTAADNPDRAAMVRRCRKPAWRASSISVGSSRTGSPARPAQR